MSKIQTLRDDVQEKIFLRNSLDAIYKSVNSETSILTSDGKIKAERQVVLSITQTRLV